MLCALLFWMALRTPCFATPPFVLDLNTFGTPAGGITRIYGTTGTGVAGLPVAGGFADTAFAAIQANPLGRTRAGEVALIFGDGTIGGELNTSGFPSRVLKIAGAHANEISGAEIWIDDVTGDGLGELLICRQNHSPAGRTGAEALTLLVGAPSLRAHAAMGGYLDLAAMPAAITNTTLLGASACDRLGIWVRTGDITGDGIADIVVGADQVSVGDTHEGAVYVVLGGAHLAVTQVIDLGNFGATALTGHVARIHPPAGQAIIISGERYRLRIWTEAGLAIPGCTAHGSSTPAIDGIAYIAWDDNFPTGVPGPRGIRLSLPMRRAITPLSRERRRIYLLAKNSSVDLILITMGIQTFLLGKGLHFALDTPPTNIAFSTIIGPAPGALSADTVTQGDGTLTGMESGTW